MIRAILITFVQLLARSVPFKPENLALIRFRGPEGSMFDSSKFQRFIAKFSLYIPLSAAPPAFPGVAS